MVAALVEINRDCDSHVGQLECLGRAGSHKAAGLRGKEARRVDASGLMPRAQGRSSNTNPRLGFYDKDSEPDHISKNRSIL